MKAETVISRQKDRIEELEALIINQEKQIIVLEGQNDALKQEMVVQQDFIQAQRKQKERIKLDLIHMTRIVRIIKATVNGVRIPGEDEFNTNPACAEIDGEYNG